MKVCTSCGRKKPVSEFSKHKLGRDGLRPRCKSCLAVENAGYRARTVEQRAEYNKAYRLVNRDRHLEYNKRWNQENPDVINAAINKWKFLNPQKVAAHKAVARAIEWLCPRCHKGKGVVPNRSVRN